MTVITLLVAVCYLVQVVLPDPPESSVFRRRTRWELEAPGRSLSLCICRAYSLATLFVCTLFKVFGMFYFVSAFVVFFGKVLFVWYLVYMVQVVNQ